MKNFILFCTSIFLSYSLLATNYNSNGSGNWNSSSSWSPSGVPTTGDNVTIRNGHTITVTANASCASITMNNEAAVAGATDVVLTINNGITLTVSGNITQNVSVSALSTGGCVINILGTLTCSGNVTQSHSLIGLLGNSNSINVGSGTYSGTCNITGTFTQSNGLITALGVANTVNLRQGTLNIDDTVTFVGGLLNLVSTNVIDANDNGSYDGKVKRFNLGGNFAGSGYGQVTLSDSDNDTDYNLTLDGNIAQTISTSNKVYKKLIISNTSNETVLDGNLSNTNLKDSLVIKNGAILNISTYNLDAVTGYAGQLKIESGGTLKIQQEDGVPAQKVSSNYVLVCDPNGIIEFNSSGTLNVFKENFDYPTVKLSGSGTKTLHGSSDIDNSLLKVGKINLTEGTFEIGNNKKLVLNNTYGTKTLTQSTGTILKIGGDFNQLDAYFSLHRNSTVEYNKAGNQTVYALSASAGVAEPYGILSVKRSSGSGAVVKNIAASTTVKVENKVLIGSETSLTINQSAILELLSDVTYTAYISEIPSNGAVAYAGSPAGKVLANRYISLPDDNFRDISSPIKSTTLESWETQGMYFMGITGSDYPNLSYTNAYRYDESDTQMLDSGWVSATNTSNTIQQINGSNQITNGAWRIYTGDDNPIALTLKDQGEIYQGDVNFLTTFTHGSNSRSLDDGWNFLGNPYPSAINWGEVYRDAANSAVFAANGIQPTIYVWKPYDQGNPVDLEDSYGFYNANTGVGDALDSIIPAFQGFWVKTYHASSNNASYELKLKEAHKYDSSSSLFHKSEQNKALVVEINLSGADHLDKVWFHTWPGATVGKDEIYDVQRFALNEALPSINFTQNNEVLNVWVNALPKDYQYTELPLNVNTPQAGNYTLSMKNFDAFTQAIGCITVVDLLNNTTIDLSGNKNYVFHSDAGFQGTRFIMYLVKPIADKISIADASCQGAENGKLLVDLKEIENTVDFVLYKEGVSFKIFSGNLKAISADLGAGNYELESKIAPISCASNRYVFSISEPAAIVANFSLPSGLLKAGNSILFTNSSLNAQAFEWHFSDDNSTSSENNPSHTFANAGWYTITLKAIGSDPNCFQEQQRTVEIQHATGITTQNEESLQISSNENGLSIHGLSSNCEISIYSLDGRLIYQAKSTGGEVNITLEKQQKIYLINILKDGEKFTQKTIH